MASSVPRLTSEEQELLDQHFPFYLSLASGERLPKTDAQDHFVRVCRGAAPAETPHEIAYMKWRRIEVQSEKEALARSSSQSSIPEREEGYPDDTFFTREDAKKLRSRQFADMKSRNRS